MHSRITEKLQIWTGSPKLMPWEKVAAIVEHPKDKVRVAMVGKYVDLVDSYKSLNEALAHGGIANECEVEILHVDSEKIEENGLPPEVSGADAVMVPMGFGPRGTEGKIEALRYARENNVPLFGICYGMQMAVVEFARHVCIPYRSFLTLPTRLSVASKRPPKASTYSSARSAAQWVISRASPFWKLFDKCTSSRGARTSCSFT